MNKGIKIVALDLDGTLTNSEKKVTPLTKEAVDKAREQGIKIVLASGRPHIGIKYVADTLEVEKRGGYILSFNGGQIVDSLTGEVILQKKIDPKCFETVCETIRKFPNVYPLTYDDEGLISEDVEYKYVERESFNCGIPKRQVENLYEEVKNRDIVKFMIVGEHEDLEPVREYLQEQFPDDLAVYYSESYFLEVVAPGIAKDTSLEVLINKLGFTVDELMACGDGLNDLSMLNYVGFAVAMGNSYEEVKEVADYITKSNDEDGVAYAFEQFVLE